MLITEYLLGWGRANPIPGREGVKTIAMSRRERKCLGRTGRLGRNGRPDAESPVLLDPIRQSEDGTIALTTYAVFEDGSLLAYGLAEGGSDWREWRVRDAATVEDRPDRLRWMKFSGASWTYDRRGFYCSRYDVPADGQALKAANRDQKLDYHALGTAQEEDVRVRERPDEPEWGFGAQVTEDGRCVVIHVWKGTARENGLFVLDLPGLGTVIASRGARRIPRRSTIVSGVQGFLTEMLCDDGYVEFTGCGAGMGMGGTTLESCAGSAAAGC
jgi:protease II